MVSWGPDATRPYRLRDDPREQVRREIFGEPTADARVVVGFVYELVLEGQRPGEHPYVGKVMGATKAAVTRRVHGNQSSAHTSLQSIARDPWKSRILSGTKGYVVLEVVRGTSGDKAENDRAVRRAEAFWIDRLNPTYNDVRPVRREKPAPVSKRPVAKSRSTRKPWRPAWGFLFLVALFTIGAAWLLAPAGSWIPWAGAPVLGLSLGYRTHLWLNKAKRRTSR